MGLTEGQDPVESAARGATEGALEWTKEQILAFAKRLGNRKLAFVRDPETIDQIRDERKGEEWSILREHIRDRKLRLLVLMGLTLRRLEKPPVDTQRLQALRTRILKKHGTAGLRAAELVQRGIIGLFFWRLLSDSDSPADISAALEDLMSEVEHYTAFIQSWDKEDDVLRELSAKVLSGSPSVFIVLGTGAAKEKAKRIVNTLLAELPKSFGAERHETPRDFYAFVGKVVDGEFRLTLPL